MTRGDGAPSSLAPFWWTLALLATAAGVGARFWGLDVQSYWTDESFSVLQSAGSWQHLLDVSRTEIHPPLYPAALKTWIGLGGTGPAWTRALGALFGALAVLVAWLGMRRSNLPVPLRAVLVVLTAVNGFAVTYAQETRPYALLWLGSVGLTTAALAQLDGSRPIRLRAFVAWGLVASGTHLFGGVLVACLAAPLALFRRADGTRIALAAVIAVLPLLGWVSLGLMTPDFAAGAARWITAPTLGSLRDLATTVFASGDLAMLDEGFAWRAPWLAVLALVLLAGAVAAGLGARGRGPLTPEGRAAALLGAVTGLLVAGVWLGSQVVHLWTLRNMIVAAPAATWLVACAVAGLIPHARAAAAALALLALCSLAALVPVQRGLAEPYKTGFGTVMEYLAQVRTQEPSAHFVLSTLNPDAWMLSADLPQSPSYLDWLLGDAQLVEKGDFSTVLKSRSGTTVYVWYRSTDPVGADGRAAAMLRRLGAGCERIPMQGIAVVRCDRP